MLALRFGSLQKFHLINVLGEKKTMREPEFAPFPTDEYVARYKKAQRLMDERGIDALLLTTEENGVYFSGLDTLEWGAERPICVVVPRAADKEPILVFPALLGDIALETSWIAALKPWGEWGGLVGAPPSAVAAIQEAIAELGLTRGTIGAELGHGMQMLMSFADYQALTSGLPEARFMDAASLLWDLRGIKSPREIDALRKVAAATTCAFEAGFAALRPGMTEKELAGIMFARMAEETGERPVFMMVRSGPRKYAMVNVKPFDKTLDKGELVVVDAGARYKTYCSDFMRMASIGEPTADQRRFFDAEFEAQQAGVDAVRPGVTTGEVFDASYQVLMKRGMAYHAKITGVGHNVGLSFHEPPRISKGGTTVLQPGMVITVEPIWYDRPDHKIGNFALEDMVLVTDTGHEVLSLYPKDLHIVRT
jgi:Xaa-Pro aminopeptidase